MTSEKEKSVVNGHRNHLALKFSVCVKESQDRLPVGFKCISSWSLLIFTFLQSIG